ncbi:MAG TPA: cobalamin-independent methionine synthase II family protein [Candidatus Acidoferrales bacterium]|nr:cobalamin-independent methionine synthase II family protein [Candidatus Acidoferrales bacterium]
MASNQSRILTTHVGSLVRPPKLVAFLKEIEADRPYDQVAHAACLQESIAEVVRQQAEAGVDIVSDGEFGKTDNWAWYIHQRISGFTQRPATEDELKDPLMANSMGQDFKTFPEFYAEYFPTQNFKVRASNVTTVCTGPIRYVGHALIQRDIENLKAAVAKVQVVDAFLPLVAPASAFPFFKNEYYKDEETLLFALADALREEYKAVLDAGLRVQIDDAFLPYTYERIVPPLTLAQYRKWAELRIDALNHALEGLPQERIRYHICWGSWNAPHTHDVPLKDIIDLILKLRVGGYQFEAANVRHEHEWKVWQSVKVPEGRVLIPGVISHATNVVEHPELVADRLVCFANIVGRENVMAGTDCGFAQGPFTRRVHPTIQWAKLRAQAEGAKLATERLWGSRRSAA